MIQWAYNTHPYSFDEYSLAFYYATLLTDECAVAFSDAAIANELENRDPAALADLNAIVTPHIGRAVAQTLDGVRAAGKTAAAVDGITIIESGLAALCDTTVAVVAPVDERVRRICLREGISEEYARTRVAAQKTEDWFRANCEHTLVNDCRETQQFAQRARDLFERILNDG